MIILGLRARDQQVVPPLTNWPQVAGSKQVAFSLQGIMSETVTAIPKLEPNIHVFHKSHCVQRISKSENVKKMVRHIPDFLPRVFSHLKSKLKRISHGKCDMRK